MTNLTIYGECSIIWKRTSTNARCSREPDICYLGMVQTSMTRKYKTRLENALAMNDPLSKAYYLKEQLREIWTQGCKEDAEKVLADWVNQAMESKIPQLQKMAMTVLAYKRGILSWYDCHISTAKVEELNNKIKVMKRNAYGFRDERYFKLRLNALHDCRITRNVG